MIPSEKRILQRAFFVMNTHCLGIAAKCAAVKLMIPFRLERYSAEGKAMKPDAASCGRGAVLRRDGVCHLHRATSRTVRFARRLHETLASWDLDEQIPAYGIFNIPQALALRNAV
jgi:hypothetical protein